MNVLLVDGSALAYRAFFALARNPLVSSRGEPTSVVYAFLTTLLRWLRRYDPAVVSVVFDAPGPTHRHRIDPQYKANRPPRPEGLDAQLPRLREALSALRLPVIERAGWEADDVLATLARHFATRGAHVYLASGDKDFRQLVAPNVHLVRPRLASGSDDEVGPTELRREIGLDAEQIVDLMALSGDPVDNVPGVPGVGEKTAAALLREHGSLDSLYAKLETVARPALRDKLAEHREAVLRARELVRLRNDVPIACEVEVPEWPGPDWGRLRALCRELELVQILRQLPVESAAPVDPPLREVRTADELEDLVSALAGQPVVALHVEPEPSGPGIVALGLAWGAGQAAAVALVPEPRSAPTGQLELGLSPGTGVQAARVASALAPLLGDPRTTRVGHDIKAAMHRLTALGAPLVEPYFDTGVAAYVLHPERYSHDFEAVVLEHLSEHVAGGGSAARRAASAAERAWRLQAALEPALAAHGLDSLFRDVEMPLVAVLADMERVGVRVDVAALAALSRELESRAEELAAGIYRLAGRQFNLQSPQQLGQVLFAELGLPHGRRTRAGWSTDADVLEKLALEHAIARDLLEYRQITKLRASACESLPRLVDPESGRIHTTFHQTVASTGRLSSSDPNLQNIPVRSEIGRRIRAAFVARDARSRLVAADYSQIELRLLAHLSKDPGLVAAFEAGGDIHTLTAARLAGCRPAEVTPEQRAAAKTVNFGVVYGMGPRGLAERLGIALEEARNFIDEYFTSYPGVRRCTQGLVEQARAHGYARTILGRRLGIPELESDQPARRAAAERLAVNAPIQGSAADLVKVAMIRVHARLRAAASAARLVLQVHDELVLDVPEDEVDFVTDCVRREMAAALPLRVPIVVDVGVGRNWAEAH